MSRICYDCGGVAVVDVHGVPLCAVCAPVAPLKAAGLGLQATPMNVPVTRYPESVTAFEQRVLQVLRAQGRDVFPHDERELSVLVDRDYITCCWRLQILVPDRARGG